MSKYRMKDNDPSVNADFKVMTIATSDYFEKWKFCIETQQKYCAEIGYEHLLIDPSSSAYHPKWAKLEIALALTRRYAAVLLLDADIEITPSCPPFEHILNTHPSKDIFFALGFSGRPNSGFLLFRGGKESGAIRFLAECLSRKNDPVPKEDFVSVEGENGHIIMMLKLPEFVEYSQLIDKSWNCTEPHLADKAYIWHYNNERMRTWRKNMR